MVCGENRGRGRYMERAKWIGVIWGSHAMRLGTVKLEKKVWREFFIGDEMEIKEKGQVPRRKGS